MDGKALRTTARTWWANVARPRVGIDTRSMAAFRIALGALLIADLLLRARDLTAFYTDSGVLPRTALIGKFSHPLHMSLHNVSGEAWVQVGLFLLAGAFAAMLLVGYRTSTVTVVSWILLVSLQNRNPVVLHGGDVLLRMLLFWAIFLPLGSRWSIDSRRSGARRGRVASAATVAALVQMVIVYCVNAVSKLSGDLWLSGEAILYVFSLDQFTVLLGDVLVNYPAVLHVMDYLWLSMLVLAPLLILLTGLPRIGFVLMFVGMHVGMLLTMRLELFPLIVIAGLMLFLPGSVWDAVVPQLVRRSRRAGLDRWPAKLDGALPEIAVTGVPQRLVRWKRRAVSVLPLIFLVLVVLWNVQPVGVVGVPERAEPVVHTTRIDQNWNLFAPEPLRTDGWYVVPGRLEDGSRIDALHRTPVRWSRPPEIAATYPNERWRKYLVNLWRGRYANHRPYLAEYLCQRWNSRHQNELVELTVYYMEQPSRPYAETEPVNKVRLSHHSCGRTGSTSP